MPITSVQEFTKDFKEMICDLTNNKVFSSLIFLCVGTDRITGDCFGPVIGYKLKKLYKNINNVEIIGDLENTVCCNNIENTINDICKRFSNPFIVSIDSAMSFENNDIGKIVVEKGGIVLGSSIGKERFIIGDMSIKGVISKRYANSRQSFIHLQNVSLGMIVKMADVVANGIFNSIET